MGKRNRNNKNGLGFYSDRYWQSADWNRRNFQLYRNWIYALALSRFKWLNLPETCDERFLEWTLLTQGMATIAFPRKQKGVFYSLQATPTNQINMYDNPTEWTAYGNNGTRFQVKPANGILIYDNLQRLPILGNIDLFARRLASFDRTIDVNLQAQHTPILLAASQECKNDLVQIYKQIAGGEPAILGTNNLLELEQQIKALNLQVPFIGEELQISQATYWSQVYTFLGIQSLPRKSERMIEDEVSANNEPTDLMALDPLTARRQACDKLNERFADYLDAPIRVVWRKDNESDNYNLIHNMKDRAEVLE